MSDVHLIGNSAMVQSTAKDLDEPRGRELLASISARDCSAMGEFYVSCFARLVNFFAFLTADDDLVEELISDTMLKVWRESATIGENSSVSAHVVALVRVADLYGELSADAFGKVTRPRRSAIDRF